MTWDHLGWHTWEMPSAATVSNILKSFAVKSSTTMVEASVSLKKSKSWATLCISSFNTVWSATAFSNSVRG